MCRCGRSYKGESGRFMFAGQSVNYCPDCGSPLSESAIKEAAREITKLDTCPENIEIQMCRDGDIVSVELCTMCWTADIKHRMGNN